MTWLWNIATCLPSAIKASISSLVISFGVFSGALPARGGRPVTIALWAIAKDRLKQRQKQTTKLPERMWRTLLHQTTELSRAGCLQARDECGSIQDLNV